MKFRLNKTVAAVTSGALLLIAVPLAGFATTSSAAAKPTYVIGYEGPLSGGNEQLGLNMIFAVQLAINNANATGKLPFKLKLAQYDDQGSGTLSPRRPRRPSPTRSWWPLSAPRSLVPPRQLSPTTRRPTSRP